MGFLSRFDVPELVRRHGLVWFVETGTGIGTSLAHAAAVDPPFERLMSCEIEPGLYEAAAKRFESDARVVVWRSGSVAFLESVCVRTLASPILFWLDAHFPGADYTGRGYGGEADPGVRLPLEAELAAIARLRPAGRDVVLVDDLRIYADGPFGSGNLPPDVRPHCPAERGIEFIHRIMGSTHDVEALYEHEGYVMLTPKSLA